MDHQLTFLPRLLANRYAKPALALASVLLLLTPVVLILTHASQPQVVSLAQETGLPVTTITSNRTISYYLVTSQELLNKARYLANTNTNQTPEDKHQIINLINQALDLANQAIAAYPQDDRPFAQRSTIYQALTPFAADSLKLAVTDLKSAISLNSQNPLYHSRLADLYVSLNDFTNAAASYYNTYLLSPTDIQAVYQLADAFQRSGQLAKADQYFAKLLSLLPPDDTNLATLKDRHSSLKTQLASQTQTTFGLASPTPIHELMGTQELPLEQAAAKSKLVIAGPQATSTEDQGTALVTNNSTSGTATLPAGQTSLVLANSQVSQTTQLVLLPQTDTQNHPFTVLSKATGQFEVGIDKPVDFAIEFKWFVIN